MMFWIDTSFDHGAYNLLPLNLIFELPSLIFTKVIIQFIFNQTKLGALQPFENVFFHDYSVFYFSSYLSSYNYKQNVSKIIFIPLYLH